jgi:two-component system invasion response regulator UvrY
MIRTLLVDDSPEFLEAATRFLSSDPNIEIIGVSLSGADALEKVESLDPDLILMDLAMPGVNGLEATRVIKKQPNSPQIIILTLHDNLEYRLASDAVGANGFIPKSEFGSELLPQIYSLFEIKPVAQS